MHPAVIASFQSLFYFSKSSCTRILAENIITVRIGATARENQTSFWGCTCYKPFPCLKCKLLSAYCGIPGALQLNAGTAPQLDQEHCSPDPFHFMDHPTVWILTVSQCEPPAVLLMFSSKCDH